MGYEAALIDNVTELNLTWIIRRLVKTISIKH